MTVDRIFPKTDQYDFSSFTRDLRLGDDDAARQLYARYATRLRTIAARRLDSSLRAKLDPDDILQSVLEDFFCSIRQSQWNFESSRDLRALLAILVIRKCARQAERYHAAGRDLARELSSEEVNETQRGSIAFHGREPCPTQSVVEEDLIEYWLLQLDEQDLMVFQALLAGEATSDIAQKIGCSRRTVQRTFQRLLMKISSRDA